ncbi:eCIS core domain-containing protein [Nocardia sp. CA-128927]|uniref:WXG100-like domain-containing protein n=1 Tax=Nocardia sp. CA-128927 TaxID=3239975 RepID=UPI003D99C9F6
MLAAYKGMAGSDSVGTQWAAGYDEAAQLAISTSSKLATACGQTRDMIAVGAYNHQVAETGADLRAPSPPPTPGLSIDPCLPETTPSAGGNGIPEPFGWSFIKDAVGFAWPNGYQDQLNAAETAWHTAAADYRTIAGQAPQAIDLLNNQQAPEIEIAVSTCQTRQTDFNALADACQTLGDACGEYAHHLDEAHHKILEELKAFVIETAAAETAFAILAPFTATVSEWVGNAALAGRITVRARRITTFIGEFATKVTKLVTDVVKPLAERLKPLFEKVRNWVSAAKIKMTPFARREAVSVDGKLFSRMGPRTNREVLESGDHLPMTQETIEEYARRAGVDLRGVRVDVANSADDVRYFDSMEASASTAPGHIALAPSAFADEQTLLRNLVHERVHIEQYEQGRVGLGVTRELEEEAYRADEEFWQRYLTGKTGE